MNLSDYFNSLLPGTLSNFEKNRLYVYLLFRLRSRWLSFDILMDMLLYNPVLLFNISLG